MTSEIEVQNKVSHYLRSLRKRKNLTQKQFSESSFLTLNQIKRYESTRETSTVASAISLIHKMAEFEGRSAGNLIDLMLGKVQGKNIESAHQETWKTIVIEKFSMIRMPIRRSFVHEFLNKCSDQKHLEESISLFLNAKDLNTDDLEVLTDLAKHLRKRRGTPP